MGSLLDDYKRLATLGNGTATLNYAYHPGTDQIASRSWQIGQNTPFLNMDNSFDDYSRLVEISANNVAEIAYTLNNDNQRTAAALNDGTSWAYGYDTKGQLLTAVREDSQNTTLNGMTYDYDGIGNRTEAEEDTVEKEYTSNLLNQYTSIETTSATPPVTETPTYDADGNMLTNGPWTYTWNTESRLTSATNGTTVLEFQYDYMGRRVEKKVTENSVVTKQENYVYDGYKLIAIYDALDSNALIMTFVWQPIGLDVPLCMTYSGNTYYYLTDDNKNVTGLFDSTGTRVATYLYGPFGQVLSSTGTMATINPFRFSSEFHDDETGLVYYNYRYYSPILGRWTRRDPIGEKEGGVNLYNIYSTPVSSFDHLGLRWIITRKGKAWATAERTKINDTTEGLSELVRLNHDEILKWLKNSNGSSVSEKDLATRCSFLVPNTMVVFTSKSGFGDGLMTFVTLLKSSALNTGHNYKRKGYLVIEHKWASSESLFISLWKTDGIAAIAFGGHGSQYGFNSEPTRGDEVNTSAWDVTPPYKLQGIGAYTCFGSVKHQNGINSNGTLIEKGWSDLISKQGSFTGYSWYANYFTVFFTEVTIRAGYENIPGSYL